jgi:hypothetical protein
MWLQAPAAAPASGDKFVVSAISVAETRYRNLAGEESMFGDRSGTELLIRVQGAAVDGATSYGQLKLTEATDDTGTDMKPKKGGMSMNDEAFTPIQSGMLGMLQKKGEKGFRVKLELGSAARKAAKIRSVKGEFQVLADGKQAAATVKNIPALVGKSIEDPQLKQAGVQIKVVDPKKAGSGMLGGGDDNSLSLQITGAITAVQEVEVLDKAGKSVTQGSMSSGSEKESNVTYQLKQPLDDTMTLKVKLVIGQKTVKVPFELKDIALP